MSFNSSRLSRRVSLFCGAMALVCFLSGNVFAQNAPPETSQPIDATGGFLQREGAQPKFEGASKLSPDARAAMREGRIFSVPHFSGSFESQGKTYPFTMVGAKPQSNATTEVPVQIIPISLFFEEFVDENGAPIVLDPGAIVPRVQASPNFHDAQYATGATQFADAVQRAEFNASCRQGLAYPAGRSADHEAAQDRRAARRCQRFTAIPAPAWSMRLLTRTFSFRN